MVRALENLGPDSSHLDFFGLTRPPFAPLSQASENFHTEQYSLLMAHLASATQQPDCLVVICGANGSGKTTLLNRYIASLSNDVSYATVDETCNGEMQFYCAILRQLGFRDITGTARELRRITKEFLVHRGMAGDPVLIMIDNAHLINPKVLEQLRWISAIKVKDRRVLSLVLAGNSDLAGIMQSPAMSQTKFNSEISFNIRAYSADEVGDYISHRVKLAGGTDALSFSNEVLPLVYRYTGGTPSLINMLCNAVLTEAHTLKLHEITEELVRAVADNRRLLPHVVPLQGKGRRKTDPDFKLVRPERQTEERITARDSTSKDPVEIPTLRSDASDVDNKDLLAQITQLSVELGELRADRLRNLKDIGKRDLEVSKLHEKINAQSAKSEMLADALRDKTDKAKQLSQALSGGKLALQKKEKAAKKLATDLEIARGALGDKTDEVTQLNHALSDGKLALQKTEKAAKKLASDLEKARSEKSAALTDCASATAKAEVLNNVTSELQTTVNALTVDLKLADQRAAEVDALEKKTASLTGEIETKASELLALQGEVESQDEALADFETRFKDSQTECESLRLRAAELERVEASIWEKEAHIEDLQTELASYNEAILALTAKNGELESCDMEPGRADRISALESELHEVSLLLAETQAQLTENPASTALPKNDMCDSKMPEKQQAEPSLAPTSDSTAIITAFEIIKDGEVQQVMDVLDRHSRIMIGRADDCDLHLNSGFVSRHHALISCTENGIYIENLNSFNGTIVNSRKTTRCNLQAGDVVEIGDFQIRPRSGSG